jgi:hypothetical protein
MSSLILEAPSNSLSFGNVSFNFLKELYERDIDLIYFPIGGKLELESFEKSADFSKWLKKCIDSRFKKLKKDIPTLKLWHLQGSESRIGTSQSLYTFYESSEPTEEELAIIALQDNVFLSSSYAHEKFKERGATNTHHIPIGFDTDLHKTNKSYLENRIHFGLMGKMEKRKNTIQILKAWAKKYAGNYKYQLSCCIVNPFFSPEDMNKIIGEALGGKHYGNINFLPYLKTNKEVNDLMNSIDIDLTGLSGAEGWNLPAFNCTALGKWSIVLNSTSHKDWATPENSILVEPTGTEDIYDDVFFKKGSGFNQGIKYTISEDLIIEKMELSESKAKINNTEGEKLSNKFTYKKTLNSLLSTINV